MKEGNYYEMKANMSIPWCDENFQLISVSDTQIVLLAVGVSKQGKTKYYNLFYTKPLEEE